MSLPLHTQAIKRGEVWWADLEPTRGGEIRKSRPALVLSANGVNRARRTGVVVPLSTSPSPKPPMVIEVSSAGSGSVAVCDQVRAVDKSRLTRRMSQLNVADLRAVEDGMRLVLKL